VYNGFGVVLSIASALLAILTYIFFGFNPLFAFWIGLLVTGLSIALTPVVEGSKLSEFSLKMILNVFENVARVVEGLGIRSPAVFREVGGEVYIVVGSKSSANVNRFADVSREGVALVFKSPVSRAHLEGFTDFCGALDHVAVERMGIAESVECLDRGEEVFARFRKIKVYPVKSLEKSIGSIYGVITASIATLTKGIPTRIAYENCSDVECVVQVAHAEGG
jgi:hypothetical protein